MGDETEGNSEDRLCKRLREASATPEQIRRAIAASTRSHVVRNRVLKRKLKALTTQINDLHADAKAPQGGGSGNSVVPVVGGGGQDRLLDLRAEIVEAKAALTLAAERMDAQTEDQSIADLTDALVRIQTASRHMFWTLGIGLAFVVPAVAIVLVLMIWRAVVG